MMVRSQVSLPAEDHRKAKARAAELGISLAEYVRQLVARDLGAERAPSNPSLLVGIGRSGGSDVARNKDEMVGDAVVEEWSRERSS